MKLSDISIRRPVLASMMSAALVLFGVIGYSLLSVREFPDIDPPVISVTTVLPGANPRVFAIRRVTGVWKVVPSGKFSEA